MRSWPETGLWEMQQNILSTAAKYSVQEPVCQLRAGILSGLDKNERLMSVSRSPPRL